MSMYMSDNQKTACLILFILCTTGIVVMWSVMGYKSSIRHANDPVKVTPEQACIAKGGIPLMDYHVVRHCEGLK